MEDVDDEEDGDDVGECVEDVDEEHDVTVLTIGGEIEEDIEDEGDEDDGDEDKIDEKVEDVDVCVESCSLGMEGVLASQRLENPDCQEDQELEVKRYQ